MTVSESTDENYLLGFWCWLFFMLLGRLTLLSFLFLTFFFLRLCCPTSPGIHILPQPPELQNFRVPTPQGRTCLSKQYSVLTIVVSSQSTKDIALFFYHFKPRSHLDIGELDRVQPMCTLSRQNRNRKEGGTQYPAHLSELPSSACPGRMTFQDSPCWSLPWLADLSMLSLRSYDTPAGNTKASRNLPEDKLITLHTRPTKNAG